MNGLRLLEATGTGAAIGIAVVLALDLTLRLIRRPAECAEPASAGRRAFPLLWHGKLAIVLASIAGYGLIGITELPADPPSPPQPATPKALKVPTAPVRIQIGGIRLSFEPPEGYCLYPRPLMKVVVAQQSKINPDNVIHAAFGNCAQLRDAVTKHTRIRDFGILMTPKMELTKDFSTENLRRIAADAVDPRSIKETLDQRLKDAASRLKLRSFSSLGMLDRDGHADYFAFLTRTKTAKGSFSQACVMAMMAIKDRLVSYYLYSDYKRDARPTLLSLLQTIKAGVAAFAWQNPERDGSTTKSNRVQNRQ